MSPMLPIRMKIELHFQSQLRPADIRKAEIIPKLQEAISNFLIQENILDKNEKIYIVYNSCSYNTFNGRVP